MHSYYSVLIEQWKKPTEFDTLLLKHKCKPSLLSAAKSRLLCKTPAVSVMAQVGYSPVEDYKTRTMPLNSGKYSVTHEASKIGRMVFWLMHHARTQDICVLIPSSSCDTSKSLLMPWFPFVKW